MARVAQKSIVFYLFYMIQYSGILFKFSQYQWYVKS